MTGTGASSGVTLHYTLDGSAPSESSPTVVSGNDVTVNQSAAVGSPEVFILSGSDGRVNGVGTISLVSGAVSDRTLTGANANRGWLNLTIGGDTPGLSSWGIGVLAVLLSGAGVWRARRSMAS